MEEKIDISTFYSTSKTSQKYIMKHFSELWEKIKDNPGRTASEKLYLYFHNMDNIPLCEHCGQKLVKYKSIKQGFSQYCCNHCSVTDPKRLSKAKQTMVERYGVEYAAQSKEFVDKTKQTNIERYGGVGFASKELMGKYNQTCLERYGVEWSGQSVEQKEKTKNTCQEKYGVDNPLKSKEIRDKIKQTNLEKYGVDNPLKSKEVREKIEQTNLEKYGGRAPIYSQEVKDKIKQTNLERYGVDNAMKNTQFQEKSKQSMLEKYGVEYGMQNPEIVRHNIKSRNLSFVQNKDFIKDIDDFNNWICNCPHDDNYRSTHKQCINCERTYKITSMQYYGRKGTNVEPCTNILPIEKWRSSNTSLEIFVKNILDNYNISYIENDRKILKGKEVDIYIPECKLAIECNGVYWHSIQHNNSNKTYHFNKWKECKDQGIQLITIWEDWITNKPKIIESIILSKLGIYKYSIGARKCIIKKITSKDSANFLEENHIQGKCKSSVNIGLFYNDEMISLMCFNKRSPMSGSKKIDSNEYELVRFCNKLNTHVIGGASKLFQFFINNYNYSSIISFSSNDISWGDLYVKLKFNPISNSISYWYINKNTYQRYHRSKFSKTELIRKQLVPEDLKNEKWTENEVTQQLGLLKIWDSGTIKWKHKKN